MTLDRKQWDTYFNILLGCIITALLLPAFIHALRAVLYRQVWILRVPSYWSYQIHLQKQYLLPVLLPWLALSLALRLAIPASTKQRITASLNRTRAERLLTFTMAGLALMFVVFVGSTLALRVHP